MSRSEHREVISPERFVIASSLDQTGQNHEDWDRKLDRKWFRIQAGEAKHWTADLRTNV